MNPYTPTLNSNGTNPIFPSMLGNPAISGSVGNAVYVTSDDMSKYLIGHYDTVYGPSFHFAQFNPDVLISEKGLLTMKEMHTMAAVHAPSMIKKYSVLGDRLEVVPEVTDYTKEGFKESEILAEYIKYVINNIKSSMSKRYQSFKYDVLLQLLYATDYGFCGAEININKRLKSGKWKGKYGLDRIAVKPPWEFGFDFFDLYSFEASAVVPYTPLTGYQNPVPIEKVMLFTYNPSEGLPYGNGDFRACYKHWYILDDLIRLWAVAMERWGSPILVIKYPNGNDKARSNANQIANIIRNSASVALPENLTYDTLELNAETIQNFKTFAEWNIGQIALNILGNTLTTSEGERAGSGSLGEVHQQTQVSAIDFCRRWVEDSTRNELFKKLVSYSFGEDWVPYTPHLKLSGKKASEILAKTQGYQMLKNMGSISPYNASIRESLDLPPIDSPEVEEITKLMEFAASLGKLGGSENIEKSGKQEDRAVVSD